MEVFHEMIYTNLCLLKQKGYKIGHEQGMFKNRNEPGFEKVGYALLKVIDPVECQKTIPWPLCEKSTKSEFRIKFVKFIKMINEKHSDARIPEMTASNLQHPGGERFVRFMFKLSTFAVKLEIKRIMGPNEMSLPQSSCPNTTSSKDIKLKYQYKFDNSIKLNIMKGASWQAEVSASKYSMLVVEDIPKLQQLEAISKHIASEVTNSKAKLESEILKLTQFEQICKGKLRDVEDENALSEWNCETEETIKELEKNCENLSKVRQQVAKSCGLVKSVEKTHSDTLCLDGSQLHISQAVSELGGSPVMNTRGQVRLEVLLRAGAEAVRRLAPSPNPSPQQALLPLARNLLTDVRQQRISTIHITECLDNLMTESKEAINKRIPVISGKLMEMEVPDHLTYLEPRPALQFICNDSISKHSSPLKTRKRVSLNTMVNMHPEKGKKVVCSIRKRRSLSRYSFEKTPRQFITAPRFGFRVPLTSVSHRSNIMLSSLKRPISRKPIAASTATKDIVRNPKVEPVIIAETPVHKETSKIPTCKRSIYGKLPTGMRIEQQEDFAELSSSGDPLLNFGSSNTFSETPIDESQTCSKLGNKSSSTEQFDGASPPKKPRKSLLDIMERYKKLRASMKPPTLNNGQ